MKARATKNQFERYKDASIEQSPTTMMITQTNTFFLYAVIAAHGHEFLTLEPNLLKSQSKKSRSPTAPVFA